MESNDFWTLIKDKKIPDPKSNKQKRLLKLTLVKKIELARKFTLNPLSHADPVNISKKELEDAEIILDSGNYEVEIGIVEKSQ